MDALVPTLDVGTHVGAAPRHVGASRRAHGRDAERPNVRSHAERGNEKLPPLFLLHFVSSALAIENVSRFANALAFTSLRLFAAADVGANLVAA